MEPSAVPMMESAGAAPAGPVSTAHSVSFSHPVSRHTVSSTGSLIELQQMASEKQCFFSDYKETGCFYLFFYFYFFKARESNSRTELMVISLMVVIHPSHLPRDRADHQYQSTNLNFHYPSPRGVYSVLFAVWSSCYCAWKLHLFSPLFSHIDSYYLQLSSSLFPPLGYVDSITAFSAEAGNVSFQFIHIVSYWVCSRDIEWYWFPRSFAIWPWLSMLSSLLFVFTTPPTPTFYTSLSQAVLQGSMAGTAPKSAAAKTVQTATTYLASVLAEPASLGRAVSRVE